MKNEESEFLKVAKKAAQEAAKIISKYSGQKLRQFSKEGINNFATIADKESEKKIIEIIQKSFPDHGIIAEESGESISDSEYKWAIDPLDGTIAFSTGMPFSSISIGLLKNNQPLCGVIFHISSNNLYWAEKDKGAFLNHKKIHVSQIDKIKHSSLELDLGTGLRKERIEKISHLVNNARFVYFLGGAALELAYIANGNAEGFNLKAKIWDFAAGALIISEAGGQVSDINGQQVDWTKENIDLLASNGLIHEGLLKALNS